MGNKESEQAKDFNIDINHPRFLHSKIVTKDNQKYLQTSQAVEEKEHDKWKSALKKYSAIPDNLLLPHEHTFNRTGLCGNTGTITVIPTPRSSPTTTTPTSSAKKSTTGRDSKPNSHKLNSGASSWAFCKQSDRQP